MKKHLSERDLLDHQFGLQSARRAAHMAAHLEACEDCRRAADGLKRRFAVLDALKEQPEAPERLIADTLRAIRLQKPDAPAWSPARLFVILGTAAAAALVLVIANPWHAPVVLSRKAERMELAAAVEPSAPEPEALESDLVVEDSFREPLLAGSAKDEEWNEGADKKLDAAPAEMAAFRMAEPPRQQAALSLEESSVRAKTFAARRAGQPLPAAAPAVPPAATDWQAGPGGTVIVETREHPIAPAKGGAAAAFVRTWDVSAVNTGSVPVRVSVFRALAPSGASVEVSDPAVQVTTQAGPRAALTVRVPAAGRKDFRYSVTGPVLLDDPPGGLSVQPEEGVTP